MKCETRYSYIAIWWGTETHTWYSLDPNVLTTGNSWSPTRAWRERGWGKNNEWVNNKTINHGVANHNIIEWWDTHVSLCLSRIHYIQGFSQRVKRGHPTTLLNSVLFWCGFYFYLLTTTPLKYVLVKHCTFPWNLTAVTLFQGPAQCGNWRTLDFKDSDYWQWLACTRVHCLANSQASTRV